MKKLQIPPYILSKQGVRDVVFDTTGVRVYSASEWKKEKYDGRRRWKKIHFGINLQTKEIIFAKATSEHTHDLFELGNRAR